MGCVDCTTSMTTPNTLLKFICSTCKQEKARKTCFVARQIILQEASDKDKPDVDDISVVAYNKEVVELLGGQKASDFSRDEDARILADGLIGAIISLEIEENVLLAQKSKLRGGVKEELVARNIQVIGYYSDYNNNEFHLEVNLDSPTDTAHSSRKIIKAVRPSDKDKYKPPQTLDLSVRACRRALEKKYGHGSQAGLALVINNQNYPRREKNHRVGSEKDVAKVLDLLDFLGYNLFQPNVPSRTKSGVVVDPTPEDFRAAIWEYQAALCQRKSFSSIVIIMGHGSWGSITLPNEKSISLWTDVVYKFSEERFPQFSGKPKMFFIEACSTFSDTHHVCIKPPNTLYRATNADTLVVVSSMPGTVSYLYPTWGSVFIQKLCSVTKRLAAAEEPLHLLDIVKTVQFEMKHHEVRIENTTYKQLLTYTDMAFRRLYFKM